MGSCVGSECHRALAELWLAIGDTERAGTYGVTAFKWSSGDGDPYVHWFERSQAGKLLKQLGIMPPGVPPYDTAADEVLPWENEVSVLLRALREKTVVLAESADSPRQ